MLIKSDFVVVLHIYMPICTANAVNCFAVRIIGPIQSVVAAKDSQILMAVLRVLCYNRFDKTLGSRLRSDTS